GSQLPFTFGPAKNFTDESFARGAEHYRAVHTRKGIKVPYYVEIMRNSLAKPYARIDYYLTSLYPVLDGKLHPLFQKCYYLRDNAFVNGIDLHCARDTKHVHQDDRRPRFGGDPNHARIEPQRAHVVDYVSARCKRLERH